MVYTGVAEAADMLNFEVDSTESVWYIHRAILELDQVILKLTPQSQYGIHRCC